MILCTILHIFCAQLVFDPVFTQEIEIPMLDMGKLSHAVACAETSCGTTSAAVEKHNWHGIMTYRTGSRELRVFESDEESHDAFKELWGRSYRGLPNIESASAYVCGPHWPVGEICDSDDPKKWLKTVLEEYYRE